jgi:hypothetical protein
LDKEHEVRQQTDQHKVRQKRNYWWNEITNTVVKIGKKVDKGNINRIIPSLIQYVGGNQIHDLRLFKLQFILMT